MGGWGSGRSSGRPTADLSFRIDIAWMLRTGRLKPGRELAGSLSWSSGGEHVGSIGYTGDMRDLDGGELRLRYTRGKGESAEHVRQTIRLIFTEPSYGGRRWWMICPYSGKRSGKLYLPPIGDRFAGRAAWRLAYRSQRLPHADRPFEALFRLQHKLGCEAGWEAGLYRPKGMHKRTFDRHLERYEHLDEMCSETMLGVASRLLTNFGGRD